MVMSTNRMAQGDSVMI